MKNKYNKNLTNEEFISDYYTMKFFRISALIVSHHERESFINLFDEDDKYSLLTNCNGILDQLLWEYRYSKYKVFK